jgi:hypothetical protein
MNQYNDNNYNNYNNLDSSNQSNQFIIKFIGISITYCVSLLVLSTIVIIKIRKKHPKFYKIIDREV